MPDLNQFINHFRHGFQAENRFLCQIQTQKIYDAVRNQVAATVRTGIFGGIESVFASLLGEQNNDIGFAADMLARGLLCHSAHLPSRAFQTTSQTMYGFQERFPIATEYTPIGCSFYLPLFGAQNPIINSLENFAANALLPDNIHVNIKNPATNPLPFFFSAWQNLIQNATDGPASGFNLKFPDEYYTSMQVMMFDKQDNASLTYMFDKVYPLSVESVPVQWEGSEQFARITVSFAYSTWRIVKTNPSKLTINIGGVPIVGSIQATI